MKRVHVVLFLLALFATTAESAQTFQVPRDGTLQEAIDAAGPGDTIIAREGATGVVDIDNKTNLTIKGKGSPVVSDIDIIESADIRIEGFVVEGSTRDSAISIWLSRNVTIRRCTIRGGWRGIRANGYQDLTIDRCRFEQIEHYGLELGQMEAGERAVIRRNELEDMAGSGVWIRDGAEHIVERNVVTRCSGWAFALYGTSARNTFRRNKVLDGGVGFGSSAGDDNLFERNSALRVEYAYLLQDGVGNTFARNVATDVGTGFVVYACEGSGENRIEKNRITRATEVGIGINAFNTAESRPVALDVAQSAEVRVDGTPLVTTFYSGAVNLGRYQGSDRVEAVTLSVETDIAMTSKVDNPAAATTSTWWYGELDADFGRLHVDADHEHHQYYKPPKAVHDEAWDYDVVSSTTRVTDLEGFLGTGTLPVNLVGVTKLYSWWNPVNHYLTTWNGRLTVTVRYHVAPMSSASLFVVGNRVKDAGTHGFVIATGGVTLEKNQAAGCGGCSFKVERNGNALRKNRASRSGTYDLVDTAGTNIYSENRFQTSSFEP